MRAYEKYQNHRNELKMGDILLFRSKTLLPRLIHFFDKAYYNHAGIVFWYKGRLLIVESVGKGVQPDFNSFRLKKRSCKDFCVLRPKKSEEEISEALKLSLERGEKGVGYDFLLLPRIALVKSTGIDITGLGTKNKDICSEFARFYADFLVDCYKDIKLITPEDLLRYKNDEIEVLFNDYIDR